MPGGKLLEAPTLAADNISTLAYMVSVLDTSGRLIAACTKKRNIAQDEDWEEPGQRSDLCSCWLFAWDNLGYTFLQSVGHAYPRTHLVLSSSYRIEGIDIPFKISDSACKADPILMAA